MKNTIKFSRGIFSATVSEPRQGFGFRVNIYREGYLIGPEWLESKGEALDYARSVIEQMHRESLEAHQAAQTAQDAILRGWIG